MSLSLLRIICCLLLVLSAEPVQAEEMSVNKITLGHFKVKNVKDWPQTDPYWPMIDRHNLTIDDYGYIYILNLLGKEILVFKDTGSLYKKIQLLIPPFDLSILGSGIAGDIEVSGNGKRIFVFIPPNKLFSSAPGYIGARQYMLDENGKVIKEFAEKEFLGGSPDRRLCNNTYIFLQGPGLFDENFQSIKDQKLRIHLLPATDSKEEYYDVRKRSLIKYTKDDKKIWEKQFDGYFEIIGIDRKDFLYVNGRLTKSDLNNIYKIDPKGNIVTAAPMPDPFPFLTQEEKDTWDTLSTDEFFSFLKLSCSGDVYLIYQLKLLPSKTFQRWLKGGEYFIYKFETKR